jgi:cell division protein FtsB
MTRRNRSHRSLQRRRRTSWGVALVFGGMFTAALVFSFFFDDMGVRKYIGMLQHAGQLEDEIRKLERENAQLRTDMYRIQHDPVRIEELARERLGFVKKGDTVYQIIQDTDSGEKGQAKGQ